MAAHFLLHLLHQDMEATEPSEPYCPDARSVRMIKPAPRELTHPRQYRTKSSQTAQPPGSLVQPHLQPGLWLYSPNPEHLEFDTPNQNLGSCQGWWHIVALRGED